MAPASAVAADSDRGAGEPGEPGATGIRIQIHHRGVAARAQAADHRQGRSEPPAGLELEYSAEAGIVAQ
jgi:hypothetical protein